MTENEIQLLGFERNDEEDLYDNNYRYYSYTVAMGLQFISNSSDEIKDGDEWYIDFFNSDPTIRFTEFGEVQALINLLEKRIIKSDTKEFKL
jgi:hypothetical protein